MKFFKNIKRKEGDSYDDTSLFVYGKCFRATQTIVRLPDGTALDNDNAPDGWYVIFNIPFKKTKKCMSTQTWESTEDICYPKFIIRIRKIGNDRNYSLSTLFVWMPAQDEDTDAVIRYDDPYLSAIKTTEIIKGKV